MILGLCGAIIVQGNGIVGQFAQDRVTAYEIAIQRDILDQHCMRMDAENPCFIGAPDEQPSVAIWGDSHAGAIVPGFDEWLKSMGRSAVAYTKSACLPLLGVYRADLLPGNNCEQHNASVIANITMTPAIDTVIIFGRWALATEGTRAKHEPGNHAILAKSGEFNSNISLNPQLVEYGLNRLVKSLRANQINVVIISGVPEIGFNVPDIVLQYGNKVPDKYQPSRRDVDERNARADQILDIIAERYGALIISPIDLMCTNQCIIQIEGSPIYRDDDHLSPFGARWIVPNLMHGVALY